MVKEDVIVLIEHYRLVRLPMEHRDPYRKDLSNYNKRLEANDLHWKTKHIAHIAHRRSEVMKRYGLPDDVLQNDFRFILGYRAHLGVC